MYGNYDDMFCFHRSSYFAVVEFTM